MAEWQKSGSAAPPRPVRRDGSPPAPTRKTPAEEAAAAEENHEPVAQPTVPEISVSTVSVIETLSPQRTVEPTSTYTPQRTAPVSEPPVVQPKPVETKVTETRRPSIFAAPGSSTAIPRTATGSGVHPVVNQPLVVSALETSTPVQASVAPAVQEPAVIAPVAAPVTPVQATPAVTENRRASDTGGPKFRNIRNQKMALSLPVVITHPAGKEDTRTVFVLSRGAVVFLSAAVQSGLQVNLKNPNNGKSSDCRIVGIERGPDGVNQVELEFLQPMPGFWPVHFPPEDWNPEDRRRPLPTPAGKPAATPQATPTPAVETKPVVSQPAVQPLVQPKETKTVAAATAPVIKTPPVLPSKITARTPSIVMTPLPVAEPVQPQSSLSPSASSTTLERAASGSGYHEARTAVTPHLGVPSFAHGHASKKPTGMILGILGVVVVVLGGAGYVYFKGGIGVSAGSKQPSTTTPAPATITNPGNLTPAGTNPTTSGPGTVAATGNAPATAPATQPETPSVSNTSASSNNNRPAPSRDNSSRNQSNNSRNNTAAERPAQQQPAQQQTPAELTINNHSSVLPQKTVAENVPSAPQPVVIAANNTAPNINIPPVESHVVNARTPGASKDAVVTRRVSPTYPPPALSARIQGPVKLQVQIDEKGNVVGVRSLAGNPMLVQAATAAVKQWRYSPAIKDDKPVSSSVQVQMDFTLPR